MARPIGVTILAILKAILWVFVLISGILLLSVSTIYTSDIERLLPYAVPGMSTLVTGSLGVILVVISLIHLAIAYGLWEMKKWAWALEIVVCVLNILGSLITLNLLGIIIPAIIIWYLWSVRDSFG